MEPNAIYATREGNLGGETVEMSVDAASMAHVMSILTDLYSKPSLAVVREYSTNAFDSHVAAGVSKPIEVSLPNRLSPFFKVRDYGVGLSVEDIRDVYSKYGASTKRSTNEQVGMLGLGCKSALTYTQQFTVRAVKDGMLSHVAISRTENGSGVMQVVCVQPTDEPNGVEISVPVEQNNDFHSVAQAFFQFWEPGTVLVDGVEPKSVDGIDLGDDIQIVKGSQTDYVVMGNVGYRVASDYTLFRNRRFGARNFSVVAKVPIGSVNFTPSREDLHYTDKTITTLDKIRDAVSRRLMVKVQDEVNSKASHPEARHEWLEWRQMCNLDMSGVTYKGDIIPMDFDLPHLRYRPDYGRSAVSFYRSITFNEIGRWILIHGYEKTDEIPSAHRVKMRLWAEQKGYGGRSFIVTSKPIEQKWFTNAMTGSWDEVFATKKPRTPKNIPSEFFPINDGSSKYPKTQAVPDDKTVIVWSSADENYEDWIPFLVNSHGNAVAVRLAKNRWDKFLREHKNAVKATDEIPRIIQKAFDALSADEKVSMSIQYEDRSSLACLDGTRLDDPELARYTRIVKSIRRTDAIEHFGKMSEMARRLGFVMPVVDKVDSPRVKYPLLAAIDSHYNTSALEHFYSYANTFYAKEDNA